MKKQIKNIPFLGKLVTKISNKLQGAYSFKTSGKYWEDRYKNGGNSGAGSYDKLAQFKGEVINKFVAENNIKKVIELGSGDGNQLKYFKFKEYIGLDISETAISICQKMYKNDTTKKFKIFNGNNKEKAELTLSLDVIYHLIEEEVYHNYMEKLFSFSTKYVLIYSSNKNQIEEDAHVKHRKFTTWIKENYPEFKEIKHIPNKYQYNGNKEQTSCADFYIFSA